MVIEIENTSSPGASFTINTNSVMLKTYNWICENKGLSLPFRDFRKRLEREKGINDNNNRNIYPLLKNGGMVEYEKGVDLQVDRFYTNTGLAYVKTLESVEMIENEEYSEDQKKNAIKRFQIIQNEIVYGALKKIIAKPDVNYVEPFMDLIRFLIRFGRVSKIEYAYLLYVKKTQQIRTTPESMDASISSIRSGDLEIEVNVTVRNDLDIREKTNSENRKEGLTFLTSYGYFTSLLQQAGLIKKDGKYYYVIENKKQLLSELGGI